MHRQGFGQKEIGQNEGQMNMLGKETGLIFFSRVVSMFVCVCFEADNGIFLLFTSGVGG